jgi:hypothetical protein
MKKIFLTLILCSSLASAQNTFYKTYGTAHDDVLLDMERCMDGGYYLIGRTNTSLYREDGFVVRTDSTGNILWEKIIQFDTTSVYLSAAGMLKDESVILVFKETTPFPAPITIAMKMDPAGDTVWTRVLGTSETCCFSKPIIPLDNGEFLLEGRHMFSMGDPFFGCVYRIDSAGNTLSLFRFTDNFDDVFVTDYTLSPDSEIIFIGYYMEHIATHPPYSFLIKCDLDGNFISGETYTDSTGINLLSIHADEDHTFTLLCSGNKLLKTDTAGVILLSRTNTGNDFVESLEAAPDSGYFITGGTPSGVGFNGGIARTNDTGDTLWTKQYLSWNISPGITMNSADRSLTFSSSSDTITNLLGATDVVLIRADSSGNTACYEEGTFDIHYQNSANTIIGFDSAYNYWRTGYTINYPTWHQITVASGILSSTVCSLTNVGAYETSGQITLSPNPVTQNHFQIFFSSIPEHDLKIELFSLDGKEICDWIFKDYSKQTVSLPGNISNGIYFLKIFSEGGLMNVQKLVVGR